MGQSSSPLSLWGHTGGAGTGGGLGGLGGNAAWGMASGRVPTGRRQWPPAGATAGEGAAGGQGEHSTGGGLVATVQALWSRVVRPMQDFGFGRKSIWEGGVGLFLMGGLAFLALLVGWAKGFALHNRTQSYQVRPHCAR
jgi:hypothetical protein